MKKTSLKIRILSGMLCTGLALSGSSLSFAAVVNNENSNVNYASSMDNRVNMDKQKLIQERHAEIRATLESVIKESVESKIITKEEGDKVLAHVLVKAEKRSKEINKDEKCKSGKCEGSRGGLFNSLVSEGILTKEKSDILREKVYTKNSELRAEKLEKGLNSLVDSKVLTSDQCDKVKKVIVARNAERKENYKKMRNMSENERKDFIENNKDKKVGPLKELIDNGTITKEQGNEIQKILPHFKHKGK